MDKSGNCQDKRKTRFKQHTDLNVDTFFSSEQNGDTM